jgi:cytoskeletal protein RodZ
MDVGLEIRQAREQRGLTLQQISKKTKIALHVLQAIEAADPARLPAHVFTRSFVRTYAQEVGLDPDSTVRRFLEQVEPQQDIPEATHAELEPPLTRQREFWLPSTSQLLGGRIGTAAVLTVIGITAMLLAFRGARRNPSETAGTPAVGAAVAAAGRSPAPAGTLGTPGTAGAPGAPGTSGMSGAAGTPNASAGPEGTSGATLHLAIAPTGPCWVRATVGDEVVLAKLLQPGDRRTVDAPSDVTLRLGDPASCAFSIDGKPARVPGPAGQPVTVHVMKANYSQFLVRQ